METNNFDIVIMPPGSVHYAKRVDKVTGAFLGWESKNPNVRLEREKKAATIEAILPHATKWEKEFLTSIRKISLLSDKQRAVWEKIVKDYEHVGVITN